MDDGVAGRCERWHVDEFLRLDSLDGKRRAALASLDFYSTLLTKLNPRLLRLGYAVRDVHSSCRSP